MRALLLLFLLVGALSTRHESEQGMNTSDQKENDCIAAWRRHKEELTTLGVGVSTGLDGEKEAGTDHVYFMNYASAATEEIGMLVQSVRAELEQWGGETFTVCETGFNWGGSSAAFLCASPKVHVHSFDMGENAVAASAPLKKRYPTRFDFTLGDSTKTLAAKIRQQEQAGHTCDFVFVDGGHTEDIAKADMENFYKLASHGAVIIADDCHTKKEAGQNGPRIAFQGLMDQGKIEYVKDVRFADFNRAVCVGRYTKPFAGRVSTTISQHRVALAASGVFIALAVTFVSVRRLYGK